MTPERWVRIGEVFGAALEVPRALRRLTRSAAKDRFGMAERDPR